MRLVKGLIREGARVSVYDPAAMENAKRDLGAAVTYAEDALACLADAECCVLATEWDEFRKIRPGQLKRRMKDPVLIDTRRMFDADDLERHGVRWAAIGRGGGKSRTHN
jgi:UDPglucose 6-dehydrogenase